MKKYHLFFSFAGIILLAGCTSQKGLIKSEAYQNIYREKPTTVLIMPPINRTETIEAKELFHSTLSMPICNAGYYVIPPFLSMEILKSESAYDAELFLNAPLVKFNEVFGADLALFTIIHKWDKTAIIGKISVEIEYIFKSLKSNEIAYQRKGNIVVNPLYFSGSTSPLGLIISAAITAVQAIQNAGTDNSFVGSSCNNLTLQDLPAGPYSPLYGKDGAHYAGKKDFKFTQSGSAKEIQTQTAKRYSKYTKTQ